MPQLKKSYIESNIQPQKVFEEPLQDPKTMRKMESKESKRGQKLYYFLHRLSAKELKDLHAYFCSPLLGNSMQMARMLRIIQTQVLEQGGKVIDADLFQSEFFPDTVLDDKKRKYIRIRLVQMLDRVLDFVAFMEYKGDTNAHHVHLLKAMHTRGWEKYFERTYEEIEAKPPKKDFGEYHLYRMRREIVRNDFTVSKATNIQETNLKSTVERIDIYITFISLKYACAALNASISYKLEINTHYDKLAYEKSLTEPYCSILEIKAYSHAYKMVSDFQMGKESAKDHFLQLKKIVANPVNLDKSEVMDLFGIAYNFSIWSIANGESEYTQMVRELYSDALAAGIFSPSGMMQQKLYGVIMHRMCKLGEVQWSTKFVEDWKTKILGDPNQLTYFVNRAFIHLLNHEYYKVVELLHNRISSIDDAQRNISARNTMCRAVWEIGDYQWLVSLLEAFRQYVMRNKNLTKVEKVHFLRYLELFSKMCLSRFSNPDSRKQKLCRLLESIVAKKETEKYFWLHKTLIEEIAACR